MSIRRLIVACTDGEADAWDQLITIVQPVISGIGRKYVVQDIEDFSQNVYVLLISNDFTLLRRFKGDDELSLLRYIKSIAWRAAKNQARRNRVRAQRYSELLEHDLVQDQAETELKIVVDQAMMELPREEREILTLLAAGYKHREIAEILRKPLGTILSKASRTQKKIKKRLKMQ